MQIFFSNSLDFEQIIHRYKFVNIKTLQKAFLLHRLQIFFSAFKSCSSLYPPFPFLLIVLHYIAPL